MSSKYNVSVIIINYNGKRFIDQLFRSFMKMRTDGITYEIIVVNNGNEDHSIEYLKESTLGNSIENKQERVDFQK